MTTTLYAEPRKVYSWDDFRKQKGPYSIGLDGIIDGPTARDEHLPAANFDHHKGVDRMSTRATSEQVHMEINLGLFERFRKDNLPCANVYINDPDEDTCLAWWLIKNHELVANHAMPQINRLVYCEDRLDCTAGAYPLGHTSMRRKMAWIFEPYNITRFTGRIAVMQDHEMINVVETVEKRISEYVFNGGQEIALEGHYKRIGGGENWAFVQETGPASRMAMYNDGIKAYITLVAQKADGSFVYAAGRRSEWINFPMNRLFDRFNLEEGEIITPENNWGGSGTTGGSPRMTGSRKSPKELEEIANDELQNLQRDLELANSLV